MRSQRPPMPTAANDDCFPFGLSIIRIGRGSQRAPRTAYGRLLRSRGFVAVDFDYRGAHGSGRWVSALALDAFEGEHAIPAEFGLYEWCDRHFGELLLRRYPNWKEGEGSSGMFTWNLPEDRIIHTHFPRSVFGDNESHLET